MGKGSKHFRDLVRHDQERLEALRAAIDAGRRSGVSDAKMDEILRDAQAEADGEV